jgi:hypothetical protein
LNVQIQRAVGIYTYGDLFEYTNTEIELSEYANTEIELFEYANTEIELFEYANTEASVNNNKAR